MSNKTLHSPSQTLHFSAENMREYRLFIKNPDKEGKTRHAFFGGRSEDPGKRNSNYLPSTIANIRIVELAIPWNKTIKCPNCWVDRGLNRSLSKQAVLDMIRSGFEEIRLDTKSLWKCIELYYAGHGEETTGRWCFNHGRISLQEIMNIARDYSEHFDCLNLLSQGCCSGNWCQQLKHWEGNADFEVNIYASTWPERSSSGNRDGSGWTIFMYNSNGITNPEGEPKEIRWSRASLPKDGVYKMTHMIGTNDVEDQVKNTPGKVEKLREIVEQFDSNGLSEHWNKWRSIPGYTEFQHFDNTFERIYPQFIELQTEIDEIQGPNYLQDIKLSTKTTMWTHQYSFMVERGLKWIEDEQKIERFKNKYMKSNVDFQTGLPVAEKMTTLVSVTRKINSCTEIIDGIIGKEDLTDSDHQQRDSNIRDRTQHSVDFHSLKKSIVSKKGASDFKKLPGADEVIRCEHMTRIRLVSIAEQKEWKEAWNLKELKSIANELQLHEEKRDQLFEEDKQNWYKSHYASCLVESSIYVRLVKLMKEIDEIEGEAYLEEMELCGWRTGKYYKEAASAHFKWMKKRAEKLKREEAEKREKAEKQRKERERAAERLEHEAKRRQTEKQRKERERETERKRRESVVVTLMGLFASVVVPLTFTVLSAL